MFVLWPSPRVTVSVSCLLPTGCPSLPCGCGLGWLPGADGWGAGQRLTHQRCVGLQPPGRRPLGATGTTRLQFLRATRPGRPRRCSSGHQLAVCVWRPHTARPLFLWPLPVPPGPQQQGLLGAGGPSRWTAPSRHWPLHGVPRPLPYPAGPRRAPAFHCAVSNPRHPA